MKMKDRSISFKQITNELFSLALPMALTQFIAVASGFLCVAMLSHFGSEVIAASALIFSSRISIILIGASILFSLSIFIGHAYGERDYTRIGNFMQQGWTLAILISIPIMIIFWNLDSILLHLGQRKALTDIARKFFHANIFNVLPFFLCICNQQLLYGTRKQRIDLLGIIFSVIILLICSYLFIFGHWGFPKLGVAGLGYALDLQSWSYVFFTLTVIYSDHFFKSFNLFSYRVHQNWGYLIEMFKVGWPICVQIGGEMLSFMVGAAMVGWLGIIPLAAYQVVTQYIFLVIVPLFSIAQASGVLVGQAYGEKNFHKIKMIGHAGVILSLLFTFLVASIFIGAPKSLAAFYLNIHDPVNAETLHWIIVLFFIAGIQQMIDGVRNVITGSLRGLFDTQFPMYVGLAAIWLIGIPLGYLLAFHFHFGVAGIAMGATMGMFTGMLILIYRWQKKNG